MTDQYESESKASTKGALPSKGYSMQTTLASNLLQMTKHTRKDPSYNTEQKDDKNSTDNLHTEIKTKHIYQLQQEMLDDEDRYNDKLS